MKKVSYSSEKTMGFQYCLAICLATESIIQSLMYAHDCSVWILRTRILFLPQAQQLSLPPKHEKALQLRPPATWAASCCRPAGEQSRSMAAFARTSSFCFIPWVSLEVACCLLHTAAGRSAEASLRLGLMTSEEIFGATRQTTYVYLKRGHPHWSVCPLRTSVWEEGE